MCITNCRAEIKMYKEDVNSALEALQIVTIRQNVIVTTVVIDTNSFNLLFDETSQEGVWKYPTKNWPEIIIKRE